MIIRFLEKDLDFLFKIDGKYYFTLYGKAYEVKQNDDGTWETTGGTICNDICSTVDDCKALFEDYNNQVITIDEIKEKIEEKIDINI